MEDITDEEGLPDKISLDKLGPDRTQMLSCDKSWISSFIISVILIPEVDSRPFDALTMMVDAET